MSRARIVIISIIAVFIILQLIPVNQINPPVVQKAVLPTEVESILQESCFDCHSHETNWPWYSRIAPGSFLITHDVIEGRKHLNFSDFSNMDAFDSSDVADEILEVLEEGSMPLSPYLVLHPNASLSNSETQIIMEWAKSLRPW
ncbi:MAG: heme-binding domain-containing protein [Candidatus Marinimicrobia bacterium]|nr:heme-binding domain-containing protein [Candidatus Neomarinimicrobiota bacterium]MCF7850101.1 heme-binding domain-containing protein [Candidatus Neomarinimicrobiota bacterium]MCF7905086.1 heme-binding domain-containing protein [Candidatus Neomarinimicrobiota bacterium]